MVFISLTFSNEKNSFCSSLKSCSTSPNNKLQNKLAVSNAPQEYKGIFIFLANVDTLSSSAEPAANLHGILYPGDKLIHKSNNQFFPGFRPIGKIITAFSIQ